MSRRGGKRTAAGSNAGMEELGEFLGEWTTAGDDGATVLKLEHPYEWGGEQIATLKVRPMRARDMRGLPADGSEISVDHFLGVAETCCGVTSKELDQLAPADAMRLVGVLARDFAGGPRSGGK